MITEAQGSQILLALAGIALLLTMIFWVLVAIWLDR